MLTPPSQKDPLFSPVSSQTQTTSQVPKQETIIIPPSEGAKTSPPAPEPPVSAPVSDQNPLTPPPGDMENISFASQSGSPPPASLPPTNPWPKRMLIIGLLFVFVVLLIVGGQKLFSVLSGPKEVTLTYWGLWENDAVIQPIIADFESKNPKIKIQYSKQSHKQYRERLQASIDRDEVPDVFRFHNTWIPMLQKYLNPVPTTVMTASEFASTFYPVASNDLVGGQTIYGIPLMIDGLGLYYNEDLLTAAGIAGPPTTWEDLMAMIKKIAKPEGNTFAVSAIALGTTNNVEHYSDILANMFMQNGASLVNPKGAEAEETLGFYWRFANPKDDYYTWNSTMDNSIYAFAIGKVAMILAPSWRAFDIKQMNPNLRFKIAPAPQLVGSSVAWASYWVEGVSAKSKYQKEAWEFVKYLSSKEVMTKLYTEESKIRLFGEPYARVDLGTTLTNDPYVGAYIKQAKDARSFPLASRTFDNGLNDKMIKYLENAVNALGQGSSPAQEIETMSSGFKQVLGTYGLITNTATTTQ